MTTTEEHKERVRAFERYRGPIYQTQYRLSRALQEAQSSFEVTTTATSVSPTERMRIRRLGSLLTSANELIAEVEKAHAAVGPSPLLQLSTSSLRMAASPPLQTPPQPSLLEDEVAVESSPYGRAPSENCAYYQEHIELAFDNLCETTRAAQVFLKTQVLARCAPPGLPEWCVGAVPEVCPPVRGGIPSAGQPLYLFREGARATALGTPTQSALPPAETTVVHASTSATASGSSGAVHKASSASEQALPLKGKASAIAKASSSAAAPSNAVTADGEDAAPIAVPTSAEEAVMNDIKEAIAHMKQGALKMSAMMQEEQASLKESEELLSGGINQSQQNMLQLNKAADALGGKGSRAAQPPRLIAALPGGPLVWRTVLLPLWEVVKQALLLACIVAVTAVVCMVIFMTRKPQVYRAR